MSRAVDLLITYRIMKILVTPFDKQEAFKYGIIDKDGKWLYDISGIDQYNLNDIWMNTNLMCMSEKISSVLNNIKWKKIFLFNAGEEEYLLYKI